MPLSSFLHRRSVRSFLRGAYSFLFGKRGQRRVQGWRLFYRLRCNMLLYSGEPLGKLVAPADVRVWVDGWEAFPRIEKLLRRARHTVVIRMFIWKDDETGRRMAATLLEIADRGVVVDITKEAVGDVFELNQDFLATQTRTEGMWQRFWNHPNISVSCAKHFDHAKVYVIDGELLLLTGMNISDEYRYDWHDYLVEIRGSNFVQQYLTEGEIEGGDRFVNLVMNTTQKKSIRPTLLSFLSAAERSVVIEPCYIADKEVLDLLIKLSKSGVRVTLIVPGEPDLHSFANMQSVGRLLSEGEKNHMQVLLYPGMVHGKIILVDKNRAFLGSANLMTSSLDEMGEVNVLIEDGHPRALRRIREVLRRDILCSRPLGSPPKLGWVGKWMAWVGL